MSKIIVLGQGPLPPELSVNEGQRLSAPSIRAWHFGRALHEAGHEVALVSLRAGAGRAEPPRSLEVGLTLYPLYEGAVTGEGALGRLEKAFGPDGAVGVSAWPSYVGALFLSSDLPYWGDLFGSPLAEGQAKATVVGDDTLLEPFARFEQVVLRRVDAISTVSTHQEYATIGALATYGRLNRYTDGYRLAYTIPATLDPQIEPPAASPFLRGSVVPPEAFVVLWSGGFNTWTDVDTLFAGLEGAMTVRPDLHFVATGGALPPHDSQTYPRFQALTAASPYHDRYHLLGWLPYAGLHNYYLESDLGVILDRWSYEGVLGSRTRLLDWLLYGLPAVVTVTAELTEELVQEGLAFSFPHRNSAALTALLLRLIEQPETLETARDRARQYVRDRFSYQIACRPLLDWASQPYRAPDAGQHIPNFGIGSENPDLERTLADYRTQLEAKNAQIFSLEQWAKEMERSLKTRPSGWRGLLRRFRPKNRSS